MVISLKGKNPYPSTCSFLVLRPKAALLYPQGMSLGGAKRSSAIRQNRGSHFAASRPFQEPGRQVDETRELVIADLPYVVPYQVQGDRVFILRVLHAARRWPEQL